MSFEEFCNYVKEHILEYFPEEYKDYRVVMNDVYKNNFGKLRSFCVVPHGSIAGPTQYMEPFFDAYKKGLPLDSILHVIADKQIQADCMDFEITKDEIDMLSDFHSIKDRIMLRVVGCEKNQELLEQVPHKVMGDLAATYRIFLTKEEDMEMSCLITNNIMQLYGIDLEQLHNIAVYNSMRAMPVRVSGMGEMVKELEEEFPEGDMELEFEDVGMLVVTNKQKYYGAAVAFYPEVFSMLGVTIDKYYIVPSSVHELLLIPKNETPLEVVNEMIREINEEQVALPEVLSDFAHEYDPVTNQLVIGGTLEQNRDREETVDIFYGMQVAYQM